MEYSKYTNGKLHVDYNRHLEELDKAICVEIEELLKVAPEEGWNYDKDDWEPVCLTGYEDSSINGIRKDGTLDAYTIAGDFNERYDHVTVTINDRIWILEQLRKLTPAQG